MRSLMNSRPLTAYHRAFSLVRAGSGPDTSGSTKYVAAPDVIVAVPEGGVFTPISPNDSTLTPAGERQVGTWRIVMDPPTTTEQTPLRTDRVVDDVGRWFSIEAVKPYDDHWELMATELGT